MSRRDIYYWKCDRQAAFHGTQSDREVDAAVEPLLEQELRRHFNIDDISLRRAGSQGTHLTWRTRVEGRGVFLRVENGPEMDSHLAVESRVLDRVRAAGVRTPEVLACDATRARVPFSWQALEEIAAPDLNHWFKIGSLDTDRIAFEIGAAVARWQDISLAGFGVLDGSLKGQRPAYADYFHLRLDEHLAFLAHHGFLSAAQRADIWTEAGRHEDLLALTRGCLVHKDLALWNVLGTTREIAAFIDFDDAVSGDPMDDLSLLACFHDSAFLRRAFAGYESNRKLPDFYRRRFWLHLLRNMIVKAVIRLGAGYFERDSSFFLVQASGSGADLRQFTQARLATALRGLRGDSDLSIL